MERALDALLPDWLVSSPYAQVLDGEAKRPNFVYCAEYTVLLEQEQAVGRWEPVRRLSLVGHGMVDSPRGLAFVR